MPCILPRDWDGQPDSVSLNGGLLEQFSRRAGLHIAQAGIDAHGLGVKLTCLVVCAIGHSAARAVWYKGQVPSMQEEALHAAIFLTQNIWQGLQMLGLKSCC